MSLEAYSLCPGGTGKKIKFCCGDFLPELQKIDRMIEGEQYLACLQHVEKLLAQPSSHDRACLLATRCELLRLNGQYDAARAAVEQFVAKFPDNQVALAESAIAAAPQNSRTSLDWQQRAMAAAAGRLEARTYEAMSVTAGALVRDGFPVPARALMQLQTYLSKDDAEARHVLSVLCRSRDIPVFLREDLPFGSPPNEAAWKDRFSESLRPTIYGDWRTAVERLSALAAEVPGEPVIWRGLATLRGWLADNVGAAEALRKYAALRAAEPDGLEDAAEAEATAMFYSLDPLGDHVEMLKLVWTVKDAERLNEAVLSSSRWAAIPFDPARLGDAENPPPKGAYLLLDRPDVASAEDLTLETIPNVLGQALLFGKQTDREARLELVNISGDQLSQVRQIVLDTAGDSVESEPQKETLGHWSASQKLLRTAWYPPRDVKPEQMKAFVDQHVREAIFDRWPELKLGVLDGRTPREAAADVGSRARVLAAILVLEQWVEPLPSEVDFNELRSRLGLPTLGPIDPKDGLSRRFPLVRLVRLTVEGLSDEELIAAYLRAVGFSIRAAMRKFAQAIVDRPGMSERDVYLDAFATLAQTEDDLSEAIAQIERGRQAAEKAGESSASWDIMELSYRFASRDGHAAGRLLEHIQKHHIEEPGVGETLTRMLIDVGLLHPDGTPVTLPEGAVPGQEAAEAREEPSGLWTPESVQPASGGGKLWTPE